MILIFFFIYLQVKKACGTPTLLPIDKLPPPVNEPPFVPPNKLGTLFDMEMLHHLVQINKSKDFYSHIVDK